MSLMQYCLILLRVWLFSDYLNSINYEYYDVRYYGLLVCHHHHRIVANLKQNKTFVPGATVQCTWYSIIQYSLYHSKPPGMYGGGGTTTYYYYYYYYYYVLLILLVVQPVP